MSEIFYVVTTQPTEQLAAFCDELARNLDVVIVSDQEPSIKSCRALTIWVPDEEVRKVGFVNSNPYKTKTPTAWDKALYLTSKAKRDFFWFCEDDVVFSSPRDALSLVRSYSGDKSDLLCQQFFSYRRLPNWANWCYRANFSDDVLMGGFFPVCRVSSSLANVISDFVQKYGTLSFIETMLPSCARANNLTISALPELKWLAFRASPPLTLSEIVVLSKSGFAKVFHPVKDISIRAAFEEYASEGLFKHLSVGSVILLQRQISILKRRARELRNR